MRTISYVLLSACLISCFVSANLSAQTTNQLIQSHSSESTQAERFNKAVKQESLLMLPDNSITTGKISGSPFCISEEIDVTFTIDGKFNDGNKFIVQLSDSLGSFSNCVSLDSVESKEAVTIEDVKFPYYSAPSAFYRIRVISTDPAVDGSDNGDDLRLDNPNAIILSGDTVSVCENSSAFYTCNQSDIVTYSWYVEGGEIQGFNTMNYVEVLWGNAGTGSIKLVHQSAITTCYDSVYIPGIVINSLPHVEIITGETEEICCMDTVQYECNSVESTKYAWFVIGGEILGGSTSEQLTVHWTTPGFGRIAIVHTNSATGCVDSIVVDDLVINPIPMPYVISGNTTAVAEHNEYDYECNSDAGIEYKWIAKGGTIVGQDNQPELTVMWGKAGDGQLELVQKITETGCTNRIVFDIEIQSLYASIAGAYETCLNAEEEYLVGNTEDTEYQWLVEGGQINGPDNETQVNITWDRPGEGSVAVARYFSNPGTCDTLVQDIIVHELPIVNLFTTGDLLCEGSIYLYMTNQADSLTAKWTIVNGQIIGESNSDTIRVQWDDVNGNDAYVNGIIKLERSHKQTGCSNSASKEVKIYNTPNAIIDGLETACSSQESEYISSAAAEGTIFQWEVEGGTITGPTNSNKVTISWSDAGTCKITLIESTPAGCADTAHTDITINQSPDKPEITVDENTLIASDADNYQWYKDSVIIAGASEKEYKPTEKGAYSVSTSNENGCSSMSDMYNYDPSAVDDYEDTQMQLKASPNPMTGATEISYYLAGPGPVSLSIYDLTGSRVATLVSDEFRGMGRHSAKFEGRGLATGTYYCKLSYRGRVHSILLLVSR